MSSLEKSLPPLPDAWVDRLFARLTAIYGSQKVGAMWLDTDRDEVKRTWAAALGKYPPEAIRAALEDLPETPTPWPPTLPEFVGLVREAAQGRKATGVQLRLPAPSDVADPSSPVVQAFRAEFAKFMQTHTQRRMEREAAERAAQESAATGAEVQQ
jgi:hypothetical protein